MCKEKNMIKYTRYFGVHATFGMTIGWLQVDKEGIMIFCKRN